MKKLSLLIIAVLLIGLSGYSQTTVKLNLSAGDELILSTKNYYTGTIITIIGGGVSIAASFIQPEYHKFAGQDANEDIRNLVYGIGGAVTLVGIGFILESKIHIKKAGLLLNENGIGIAYKIK